MNKNIPAWALRAATAEDQSLALEAHRQGSMQIKWPDANALRGWAKQHGWPTPWFSFESAFLAKMLATSQDFELALADSGIEIQLPRQEYTITGDMIRDLDDLYVERSSEGRPNYWDVLVEELREIRRAVEAGVVVNIEGEQPIRSWQDFYTWAHGRYYMLEDGYDKWIGDDS